MGFYALNEKGFFNKGGGRVFRSKSLRRMGVHSQPLSLKQRYHSAVRARTRMANAIQEAAQGPQSKMELEVSAVIDQIQREAGTVQEAEESLRRKLAVVSPSLPAESHHTARRLLRLGAARTMNDAVKKAVAVELGRRAVEVTSDAKLHFSCEPTRYSLPGGGLKTTATEDGATPLGYLQGGGLGEAGSGGGFAEWFGRGTERAGGFGRALNSWFDWTCSPMDTAIGSMVAGAFGGPAAGTAAAEGATTLKTLAGCDLWNLARKLKNQLRREGRTVTRSEAMELLTSNQYLYDPNTDRFFRSGSLQGIWLRIRPLAPYIGAAAAVWLLLAVTKK